ncbi:penicillin-binding protein 2 [Tessaracoccus sp. OH4464_COT-324]|uniref:peptidoglycan D,D-transpeptidase FtsI family protein n=1 Tax=Tessaracoccus sp. OH4464_COT-324 TaxID=2491059 RepID=UPI000F63720C|nr:penicillin-binding protein 2 [Tessaracoccus sp. OH4464_COT-324]RRD47548.1 penicillin-binding protein 2 [Tessaracoccus sp. OH4464_COT-324]
MIKSRKSPVRENQPRSQNGRRPRSSSKKLSASAGRRYRGTVTLRLGNRNRRLRLFAVSLVLLLAASMIRAVQLQAIDPKSFADEAIKKMQQTRSVPAMRGDIRDRNDVTLAMTEPGFRIVVDAEMIHMNGAPRNREMTERERADAEVAPGLVADILVKHIGGRRGEYLEVFNRKKPNTDQFSRYEIVARRISAHVFNALMADLRVGIKDGDKSRRLFGVYGEPDPVRLYPNRYTGSNVVGFVNGDGNGASGLEFALDSQLKGEPGQVTFDRLRFGRIPLGTNVAIPAVDGTDYQLTIDSDLSWVTDQFLAEGLKNSGAKTGTAIVMDVNTAEVLAMSVLPSFDSSNPAEADFADLGNRAVAQAYEPGSTQKVLTMAALADQGLVTPDTRVQVPARIRSGAGYVRDSFEHGTLKLTARGVVAQSSNIGTIMLARQADKAKLSDYYAAFGLGSRTGVELPGEAAGRLPGKDMPDYTRDQISFGQGLSVNALQMASAISAVVNGGMYHAPRMIKSATAADGSEVELPPAPSRRVISEEASKMTVEMMEAVTMLDPENRAIPGYRTAGKSGTAQRFDERCKCYNGFTSSYVAVAPAEDPQLLVYVVLDQPSNGNLGSRLALPVVNQILQVALPRYNVLPSSTAAPSDPLVFE